MEDDIEKIENNLTYALSSIPLPETEEIINIYYNCTKCPSLIELISIDENKNVMEFKCLNKNNIHNNGNITISIRDYLRLMANYRNENLKNLCEIHKNNNYICYCYECEKQLCYTCLKEKIHMTHKKIIIAEIEPVEEELKIVENKLQELGKIINKLRIQKYNIAKELNELNNYKRNGNKILEDIIKKNKINEEKELKSNDNKYIIDIKEIKKRYEKRNKIKEKHI